ncbi:MAG: hypothetical protein ABI267_03025, partial [Ginsengibacter sp.]
MSKIRPYLKVAFLIFLFAINSCKKDPGVKVSFQGTIIDEQTLRPVPNYPLSLNFIHASTGMGLNLGSYSDIAKVVTNGNGEFTLTIHDSYTQDSSDNYEIQSVKSDTYFGMGKEINAKTALAMKNNFLDTIKVYQKIVVNLYVRHSG